MPKNILVTGGAGYIGSVTTDLLHGRGRHVVVLDSLEMGHKSALRAKIPFYRGDVADRALLREIFARHQIEGVVHFAGYLFVPESVRDPAKYYTNNTANTLVLLDEMRLAGIGKFVFSSTSATYGEPQYLPMDEIHPQNPTTPYGMSKLFVEKMLQSFDDAYGMKHVALRYFNACGATESLGEDHDPEIHLIPLVLQTAMGKRTHISIFGTDYPTPDGTCVRDYIHVSDLAEAHLLALDYLDKNGQSQQINLGNGSGFSVRQVVEAARKVTGKEIPAREEGRREGDPSTTTASVEKARTVLGWEPRYSNIEDIIRTAWIWHSRNPDGYPS